MADKETNECISSIAMMMASVNDERVKASTISYAPERLQESREEAYKPKVVSIGPLHRGTRGELQNMEETKWCYMSSLLYRTSEPEENPELEEATKLHKRIKKRWQAICAVADVVRATYTNEIKFNNYDLAKIMFLDGCFLLELLIRNDVEKSDKATESSPEAEVGKMEPFQSDLKLLENQIPIFILVVLLQNLNLFPNDTPSGDFKGNRKIVNGLALFFLGCSPDSSPVESPNCAHFLELMHWYITKEDNSRHLSITVDRNGNCYSRSTTPKLKRCAARLKAAGVAIGPLNAESGSMSIRHENRHVITFGANIQFSDREGTLEIQPLHINETTEVLWRNFIAWEQNRTTHEKFHLGKGNPTRCKFTQYALLFNGLVCCEHDVQLLRDQNVLRVDNNWKRSNEDVMTLFQKIVRGIQTDASGDCRFDQLINGLNTYSRARGNRIVFWHSCKSIATSTRYKCRYWYVTLKRDHTPTLWKTMGVIAAIFLLGLTIAQTIFAAISL